MLVGQVFQDRRALGKPHVAIDQQRHLTTGIERCIGLLVVRARHQVDHLFVKHDAAFGAERARGARGGGYGVHVELYGCRSGWVAG